MTQVNPEGVTSDSVWYINDRSINPRGRISMLAMAIQEELYPRKTKTTKISCAMVFFHIFVVSCLYILLCFLLVQCTTERPWCNVVDGNRTCVSKSDHTGFVRTTRSLQWILGDTEDKEEFDESDELEDKGSAVVSEKSTTNVATEVVTEVVTKAATQATTVRAASSKPVRKQRVAGQKRKDTSVDFLTGFLIFALFYLCIMFVLDQSNDTPSPELRKCKIKHHSTSQGWATNTVIKIELETVPGPVGKNYKLINHGGTNTLEPRRLPNEGVVLCICPTCRQRRQAHIPTNQELQLRNFEIFDRPPLYRDLFKDQSPPTYTQALELESIM